MSVHNVVFIKRGALPTQAAWQAALEAIDPRPRFDHDVDMRGHVGGVVMRFGASRTGFEYFLSSVRDYLDDVDDDDFTPAERRDLRRTFADVVSLVTHSSLSGYLASTLATAALAIASGGRILDCQTGKYFEAEEAQSWARNIAVQIEHDVEQELAEQHEPGPA